MNTEFLTKDDLQQFRTQLLIDVKELLQDINLAAHNNVEGYKTKDVRRILNCSYNTLMKMKRTRKIRAKKVLGTWYFNTDDVKKLLKEDY